MKRKSPTKITPPLKKDIVARCAKAAEMNPGRQAGSLAKSAVAKIAIDLGVSPSTIGKIWKKARARRPRPTAFEGPKHSLADVMVATALTAPVLDGPAPKRSTKAEVSPSVNVMRIRGAVLVVFDINANIADVITTTVNAWTSARA